MNLLSVVLVGASVVVAAVIPSKNSDEDVVNIGMLQLSSLNVGSVETYVTWAPRGELPHCNHMETTNDSNYHLGSSTSDQGSGSDTLDNPPYYTGSYTTVQ